MIALAEWDRAWGLLGGGAAPSGLLDALIAAYEEPHRAYHTLHHLDECFVRMDAVRHLLARPAQVALALWFHDAVYDPRRADNEARSADWADRASIQAALNPEVVRGVRDLILATRHDAAPPPGDAAVLVDLDLAILGAEPSQFDEYERQIRSEYAWVDEATFREARGEILRRFLARPRIYATDPLSDLLERPARENLARSLANGAPRPS